MKKAHTQSQCRICRRRLKAASLDSIGSDCQIRLNEILREIDTSRGELARMASPAGQRFSERVISALIAALRFRARRGEHLSSARTFLAQARNAEASQQSEGAAIREPLPTAL